MLLVKKIAAALFAVLAILGFSLSVSHLIEGQRLQTCDEWAVEAGYNTDAQTLVCELGEGYEGNITQQQFQQMTADALSWSKSVIDQTGGM